MGKYLFRQAGRVADASGIPLLVAAQHWHSLEQASSHLALALTLAGTGNSLLSKRRFTYFWSRVLTNI